MFTNLINGKKYVGQTVTSLQNRLRQHRCKTSRSAISRAIHKYGEVNFCLEVLHITDCRMSLDYMEAHFIALYDTAGPNGYNLTYGGESSWAHRISSPMLGKTHSEETKRKMSLASKGKPKSPEHRKKIGLVKKGIKFSDAMKKRMSEVRLGKSKKGSPILDTQTGIVYKSVTDACKQLDICRQTMVRWLRNKLKHKIETRFIYKKGE